MSRFETLQGGDRGRGRRDKGRLVALAAIGYRGEIGGIGLDQQPVERQVAHDRPQLLGVAERDDAGNRDVEAERERRFGQGATAAEAVHHTRRRPLLFEDPGDFVIRLAGMND